MPFNVFERDEDIYADDVATLAQTRDDRRVEDVFKETLRLLLEEKRAKRFYCTYDAFRQVSDEAFVVRRQHEPRRWLRVWSGFDQSNKDIVTHKHHDLVDWNTIVSTAPEPEVFKQQATKHLEQKIQILEHQLRCDRPYLQLYRLGAGTLFASIVSLLMWEFTGVGAPFHPIFAAVATPVAAALIGMAFLIKPKAEAQSGPSK